MKEQRKAGHKLRLYVLTRRGETAAYRRRDKWNCPCHTIFGWPVNLWYGLSLPVASMVAHYYLRGAHRFAASLRSTLVLIRAPVAARGLLRLRREFIAEIEAARWEVPAKA